MPEWVIDGIPINIVDKISYLGSEFGDLKGDAHCVQRVCKATRAFNGLQGAGVKYPGVQPHIALEFYNTAILGVIGYGCSHITPVLKAMGISPISTSVAMESLDLIKKSVLNNSIARDFYCKTLFMPVKSIYGKPYLIGSFNLPYIIISIFLSTFLIKNMAQILKIVVIEGLRMERMVRLTVFGDYLLWATSKYST